MPLDTKLLELRAHPEGAGDATADHVKQLRRHESGDLPTEPAIDDQLSFVIDPHDKLKSKPQLFGIPRRQIRAQRVQGCFQQLVSLQAAKCLFDLVGEERRNELRRL